MDRSLQAFHLGEGSSPNEIWLLDTVAESSIIIYN